MHKELFLSLLYSVFFMCFAGFLPFAALFVLLYPSLSSSGLELGVKFA